jgi:hypothetical protein
LIKNYKNFCCNKYRSSRKPELKSRQLFKNVYAFFFKKAFIMKKMIFASAFAIAIMSAFAFKAHPTATAFYNNGANCNSTATLDQTGCSTSNTKSACTVTVGATHPNAFNTGGTSCSNQLFSQP